MDKNTKKQTRRERLAEELKSEILNAAVEVFNENGYEKATTKKIAEKAGVSEGTLYNYFSNKRDILITLFKNLIADINNNLKTFSAAPSTDIKKMLSSGLAQQLQQLHSHSITTLFLHESKIDPEVQKVFTEMILGARKSATGLLKHLKSEGKIRQINYGKMAILMSVIGIGYTTLLETGDEELNKISLKELTADFADILVNGIKS